MLIKTLAVGQLQTNCYIVTDERTLDCAIIDPGAYSYAIMNYIEENKLKVKAILLTHGHFDHTGAVEALMKATSADLYVNRLECQKGAPSPMLFKAPEGTKFYSEGDVVNVSGLSFEVMETPGHSPGSVTLRCEDALFTGDTLFRDSCGRTDLDGGSMEVLLKSLKRLYDLEGEFEVYPGHADQSTLSRERRFNYYMQYAVKENN